MTTTNHPIAQAMRALATVDVDAFDFDAWKREMSARAEARRGELYRALLGGLTVVQVYHSGTVGYFTACPSAPSEYTPLWYKIRDEGYIPTQAEIESHFFPCNVRGVEARARYLADHIENRESGFGFETVIVGVDA